ncbi:MAG: hypothetical protein ACJ8AW_32090 [Rhodopila sp.]
MEAKLLMKLAAAAKVGDATDDPDCNEQDEQSVFQGAGRPAGHSKYADETDAGIVDDGQHNTAPVTRQGFERRCVISSPAPVHSDRQVLSWFARHRFFDTLVHTATGTQSN